MTRTSASPRAGAPRRGGRFRNLVAPRPAAGATVMLPFVLRKAWSALRPRPGAAPLVPFDRRALRRNPSVTWIGHSTFLVRMDGVTFLTDPIFSERAGPFALAGPRRLVPPGVPLGALPAVDFVLLSHDHYDHTDLPSIAALAATGARCFAPLGMGPLLRGAGARTTELDWWQEADAGGVRVHCVPAQHFCGRGLGDGNRRLWAGWVVSGTTRRFYHAGDTGYFPGFAEIGRRLGPIDLAAVPIGAYDPPAIMRFVHLDPEEAVQAAAEVRAQQVVAMHFGTFDLTEEPLDAPPRRFRAAAARSGFGAERAWVLDVGESRQW